MTTAPGLCRLLRAMTTASACVVVAAAAAQTPTEAGVRANRGAQRQAVEARFRQAQVACRERFIVTPCVEQAKAERRQALMRLREQELALADAERRARAEARRQVIEAKRSEGTTRKPPPVVPRDSAARMPMPRASAPKAPASSATSSSAPSGTSAPAAAVAPQALDGGAAAATARVQSAAQRRQQADERRARIEARERERAAKGRKVQPLPTPVEIGASAARR